MEDVKFLRFSIQIYPNEEQINKLKNAFGASRYVYNYAINAEEKYYEECGGFLGKFDLNNQFTQYKKNINWLKAIDSTILKGAIFDAITAYKKFFKHITRYPKYKKKKDTHQSIYVRADRLVVNHGIITIPGIGRVACGPLPNNNIIGAGCKGYILSPKHYYNPRVLYNGYKYWISIAMEVSDDINIASVNKHIKPEEQSEPIGIDLGCKQDNWIVDSNGVCISQPDSYKIDKKIKRLRQKLDRQRKNSSRTKVKSTRSNNSIKTIKELNKYFKKKTNRKLNIIHNYVSHDIIAKNPKYVVIEDISAMQIMKDYEKENIPIFVKEKLIKNVNDAMMYTIQDILRYKCEYNNIPIYKADKEYPSTQRCSNCGFIQKIGRKTKYICPNCGLKIDRDYNASLNLKSYPVLI